MKFPLMSDWFILIFLATRFTPKSSKSKKKPAASEAEKVASAEPDGRQMRNHTSSDSESGGEILDKVSVEKMRFFCRRFKLEGSFDGQQSCSKLIRDNWSSLMGQKKLLEPQLPSKGSKKIKLSPNMGMFILMLPAWVPASRLLMLKIRYFSISLIYLR